MAENQKRGGNARDSLRYLDEEESSRAAGHYYTGVNRGNEAGSRSPDPDSSRTVSVLARGH